MKSRPKQNVIAIVYDFDGTLMPGSIQEETVFKAYGIDKDEFWKRANDLVVERGYERTLSYLKLLIHDAPFQKQPLTRKRMGELAAAIKYFPGVEDYFDRIRKFLKSIPEAAREGIELEHYIVSSGNKEILEGMSIAKNFKRIYGCEFDYEGDRPVFPKLVINDTNKTQFLFRINKGMLDLSEDINSHMPEGEKRIPFRNMIYIGDGTTDIPSMTVTQKSGGHAIAVYPPATEVPHEVSQMVEEKRADHFAPADYRDSGLLMKQIGITIRKIVQTISYRASTQMSFEYVRAHKKKVVEPKGSR